MSTPSNSEAPTRSDAAEARRFLAEHGSNPDDGDPPPLPDAAADLIRRLYRNVGGGDAA